MKTVPDSLGFLLFQNSEVCFLFGGRLKTNTGQHDSGRALVLGREIGEELREMGCSKFLHPAEHGHVGDFVP